MSHPHTLTSPVPFCLTQYLANLAKREEQQRERKVQCTTRRRERVQTARAMDAWQIAVADKHAARAEAAQEQLNAELTDMQERVTTLTIETREARAAQAEAERAF